MIKYLGLEIVFYMDKSFILKLDYFIRIKKFSQFLLSLVLLEK